MKKIKEIKISYIDEILNDENFVKNVSHSKVQTREFKEDDEWQEFANVVLARFLSLTQKLIVESIEINYYE